MKVIWTEDERRAMERYYWVQVKRLNVPRWVRKTVAERLALANLQALAKQAEEKSA